MFLNSLRLRLLVWLVGPGLLLAACLLATKYYYMRNAAEQVQDRLLAALAVSITNYTVTTGGDLLSRDMEMLLHEFTHEDTYYHVTGPDGAYVTGHADLPRPDKSRVLEPGTPFFYESVYLGETVRAVALRSFVSAPYLEGWTTIYITQTRRERQELLGTILVNTGIAFLIVVAIGGILAWIGITRGLSPLEDLRTAIRRRSPDDLRPIEEQTPAEIAEVVHALNGLLTKLDRSITANQRFIADASHQLRTPLAALQAESEWALRHARHDHERETLEGILSHARTASRLAGQLLKLARLAPEGRKTLDLAPLDLKAFAAEVTGEWVSRAIRQDIDLGFEGPNDPQASAMVLGNCVMLREMLGNLLDNALRYCPSQSIITVRVIPATARRGPVLEVQDNGPGIPVNRRAEAVERFVRFNGEETEGSGLGLAIVKEVALAHGAGLELKDSPDRQGLLVSIAFPRPAGARLAASLPSPELARP